MVAKGRSSGRPFRLLLLGGLVAVTATACQVRTTVAVDVAKDGSGTVTVAVGLDADALRRLPDLDDDGRSTTADLTRLVRTDDLAAAGWHISGPVGSAAGGGFVWIRATKPFGTPEEAGRVLGEVTGRDGPLRDLRVDRHDSFGRTRFTFEGTADLRKANVGFARADEAISYERMKDKVNDALKTQFRPEFLNRIDDTIVFHELSTDEVTQIVDLMIARVQRQLEGQGLGLELTPEAKVLLAHKGYDPQLGARPLRRAIQRQVEDPVSEKLLLKEVRAGEIVVVDAEDDPETGEKVIVFRSVEGFNPPPMELAEAGGSPPAEG